MVKQTCLGAASRQEPSMTRSTGGRERQVRRGGRGGRRCRRGLQDGTDGASGVSRVATTGYLQCRHSASDVYRTVAARRARSAVRPGRQQGGAARVRNQTFHARSRQNVKMFVLSGRCPLGDALDGSGGAPGVCRYATFAPRSASACHHVPKERGAADRKPAEVGTAF